MKNCKLAKIKASRKHAIATYAAAMAGTEFDLDTALERATLETLLEGETLVRNRQDTGQ